jgi:F-type H+-transporting ATPase subunit gamma
MSRRRKIEHHRRSLGEIRDIMNSMKTLAYVANRKLSRLMQTQATIVASIERAAADFLNAYPMAAPEEDSAPVIVLLGSERGFCGDLNHALLRALDAHCAALPSAPTLLAVGHKLHVAMEDDPRVAACIDGASAPDEAPDVLNRLADALGNVQAQRGLLSLSALYHRDEQSVAMKPLLPPFSEPLPAVPFHDEPLLNVAPEELFAQLTDKYLFAVLHELLFTALWSENHRRMTHLDGAIRRLDDVSARLKRQSNVLRQEEIVEEIEVILLNASETEPLAG